VSPLIDSTPRADGFRMPAEREPHAGTWLLWQFPSRETVSLSGHEVVLNGECFHCITQQQPAGRVARRPTRGSLPCT
jgi:agmatine/peptidylarginine deiminase